MIIGVTGLKGHGKDEVGKIFQKLYNFNHESFAAPLKLGARVMLGFSEAQVNGTLAEKEAIAPRYGVSARHALQTLGTEWGREHIHKNVWAIACLAKASLHENCVITDTRFSNEAACVKKQGGVVIRVVREGVSTNRNEGHASETEMASIPVDFTIENNGTLQQLEDNVVEMYELLLASRQQTL